MVTQGGQRELEREEEELLAVSSGPHACHLIVGQAGHRLGYGLHVML
jgi:hypothetical protein